MEIEDIEFQKEYWSLTKIMEQVQLSISDSIKDNHQLSSLNNETIKLEQKLWSWWTKEVYEIVLDGEKYAVALPWNADGVGDITTKWKEALREVKNTSEMKKLWYVMNERMFVRKLLLNKVAFPTILMKTYESHSFEIFDGKNCEWNNNPIFTIDMKLDDNIVLEICKWILKDVAKLINDWIKIWVDSFNTCVIEGKLRLFLNDVWNMKMEKIESEQIDKYIDYYLKFATWAILNSLSRPVFSKNTYLNWLKENEILMRKMKKIIQDSLHNQ